MSSAVMGFGQWIARDQRVLVVAELSGNHGGDLGRAKALIHMAKDAGADAVKLQAYVPSDMTVEEGGPEFRVPGDGPWAGQALWDLYVKSQTPRDWFGPLFREGMEVGIPVFATPFSVEAAEFLSKFQPPAYKVASFEVTHYPLLARVGELAREGRVPVILSTGMATDHEVKEAIRTLNSNTRPSNIHPNNIILMHCVSAYPAPVQSLDLSLIGIMRSTFMLPVGFSDHSLGIHAAVAAVALGACVIEKHMTADEQPTVDKHFSLTPAEFGVMVKAIREIEEAMMPLSEHPYPCERDSMVFRRSLFSARALKAGVPLTEADVLVIRPGTGMHPRHLRELVGRAPVKDVPGHTALREEMFR